MLIDGIYYKKEVLETFIRNELSTTDDISIVYAAVSLLLSDITYIFDPRNVRYVLEHRLSYSRAMIAKKLLLQSLATKELYKNNASILYNELSTDGRIVALALSFKHKYKIDIMLNIFEDEWED